MVADVSDRPRSSRAGTLGILVILAALVAAYFGNCLSGLGLPGPGPGPASPTATTGVKPAEEHGGEASGKISDEDARARIVVAGEQCRLAAETSPRDCQAVCDEVTGKAAELDATAGAQRTVDALRTCLQGRGLKVSVLSE